MKKHYNLLKGFMAFAVFFAISFSAKTQMSGTYTVGSPTADFLTIRQACDSLTILGVNGAVVLNIEDGTYSDTLRLDSVNGVSATNTITFQSLTADSANVTIQSNDTLFAIGINHVAFKNLTLKSLGSRPAILFTGSEDLFVDGCNLYANNAYGIHGYNYTNSPLSEMKNISVTNSSISGYSGIYFDADNVLDITIDNAEINVTYRAINLYGDYKLSDVTISNSTITSTNNTAIDMEGYNTYVKNISFSNLTVNSRYAGISIYSDLLADNINVENSSFKGQYPTYSTTNIYIEGYANKASNISFNNVSIDSSYSGIEVYSDFEAKNVSVSDANINVYYRGVDVEGYYGNVENVTITDSKIMVDNRNGVYVYSSDDNVKNVTLSNDSIVSKGNDAIYIYGIDVDNVSLDNVYSKADTTGSSDDGLYIYADANLTNVNIDNSHVVGGRGIYMEGYQTFENISLDNVIAHGQYMLNTWGSYGFYLEAGYGYGENLEITNSTILSDTGYAAYIEGNDASLTEINIHNSNFEGDRYPLYVEAYAGISRVYVTNSMFKAMQTSNSSYGIYLYNDYSSMNNILIDSCSFEASYCGVYTEGYYNLGMQDITVQNSTFDLDGYSYPYGVYAYSDAKIKGYRVTNNTMNINTSGSSGYGVYVGGYGGTSKVIVNNNDIKIEGTNAYGIYAEYLKDSNTFAFNTIDTNGSNYIYSGIYLYGEYVTTNGILVEGNKIPSTYYGIYGEYLAGIEILNNTVLNTDYQWGENVYLYNIKPGVFNISGNKFLNYDGYYGLDFYDIRLDSTQKGLISNNFFGNVDYGMYLENVKNVMFANNSFTTTEDNDLIELDDYNENLEFYNNIFQVDSANYYSNIFRLTNTLQIKGMDYNVSNIDTAHSYYVYDNYYNNYYAHMSDWNAYSGFDGNSFVEQVDFVNDSTNLHVLCNNTSLIAGMSLAEVTTDIDGNVRASVPTIGADEILAVSNNIFAADTMDYRAYTSVTLDAGSTSGANVYNWNTGATTQTITVDSNGWYRVTLTDACGSYTDSTYVLVNGYASVDENENELNVSIYPNPSNGEFTIALNDIASDRVNVSILNVAGQVVYNEVFAASSSTQREVNMNNQPKGVYFVQIIANDIKTVKRIIKQ